MTFNGFNENDFSVFTIPGLEPRMNALKERVRPKLIQIGQKLTPFLSTLCGEEMYPHVALHMRRTINPPNDTWVAWSNNKRGYKAHPHFQVGMWSTHLFIQFAIIYESNHKEIFAKQLSKKLRNVHSLVPESFFWSMDHTTPEMTPHSKMNKKDFEQMIIKLNTIKKSEILCGVKLEKDHPLLSDEVQLVQAIENTFEQLMPLYRMSY